MLTIEELQERLLSRVRQESYEFATKTIHLVERPLDAGTEIQIGPNRYQLPQDAFLVVIDEDPGAYWTHPVRYELHGVETYEVNVIQEQYPLETPALKEGLVPLHIPDLPHLKKNNEDLPAPPAVDRNKREESLGTISYNLPRPDAAHRYALFVTGMDNMVDFRHDFVNMRNILISRYGYDPGNIVIAMGDGSGYPDLPVDYSGTVADLDTALAQYAAGGTRELGPDDSLFLYTFNHGGWNGTNAYLCMHPNWDSYYDYQLLAKLNNIRCGNLIVAMNQCHSGGFVPEVVNTTGPSRVAIMTACAENQSAHPAATGGKGYFSVILYTALNWGFPTSISTTFPGYQPGRITSQDSNLDGMVSAEEAWQYVHDMMHSHHWHTINGYETPQWAESSAGMGANMFWGRPAKIALRVYNGEYVCAEGGGGREVVANRNAIGGWETFELIDLGNSEVALRVHNGQYVCAEGGGGREVVANRNAIASWETFELIILQPSKSVALQAHNGQYVCAEGGGGREVVANRNAIASWETFELINLQPGKVALRAHNGQYVCAEGGGGREVVANRNAIGSWETFKLVAIGGQQLTDTVGEVRQLLAV